jgi:hypothetical protein
MHSEKKESHLRLGLNWRKSWNSTDSSFVFLLVVLEFELRVSHLVGRCSTTSHVPSHFCFFGYYF